MSARKKRSAKAKQSPSRAKAKAKPPSTESPNKSKESAPRLATKSARSKGAKSARQNSTANVSRNTSKKSTKELRSRKSQSTSKADGSSKRAILVQPRADLSARELRAERARIGWETRRANEIRRERITVKANPYEEKAGDFAYTLYDSAHPLHGDIAVRERWEAKLKPYYGKRVRITVNGYTINPDTEDKTRTFIRRVGQLDGYASMFGPGSLYSKAIKVVRNRHSTDELDVTSLTIELADDGDTDGESE